VIEVDLTKKSSDHMKDLVFFGVTSNAINVDLPDFTFYKHGIIDNPLCSDDVDHAVNIVGFDVDNSTCTEYFIVWNSYGDLWGVDGYYRIKISEEGMGICGI